MIAPPSSYPFIGAGFFLGHPSLWLKIFCPFLLTAVGGLVILVLSLVFLLPLQAHALITAHCPAALAWIVSVIFVLLEVAVLTLILFAILLPIFMDALFDATLRERGLARLLEHDGGGVIACCTACRRGMGAGILIIFFQIILLIITIPLHLVPVIGTVVYCILNGWILTWSHHIHYDIEIQHFTVSESFSYGRKRRDDYIAYGAVAVALELLPVANLFFMWTNICGVALWIADEIEEEERRAAAESTVAIPNPYNIEQPLVAGSQQQSGYGSPGPHHVPQPREGWRAVKAIFRK